MTWDVLIRRGVIIDGSGSPGTVSDIALAAGCIAALGPSLADDANKVIDADGLAVTPGFIDIKTHSDFVLPINPKAESKVRQGVTTEIIGHCGFSVAPVLPGKAQLLADYLSGGAPWLPFREMSFPEYLDTFPAVAVNTGMLVGHNTLRLMVMGLEDRAPTEIELNQMIALLEDGTWNVFRAIYATWQLRQAGRNENALHGAQKTQCGLFHSHPRRIKQRHGCGRRGD